jgi:hypothetical protein
LDDHLRSSIGDKPSPFVIDGESLRSTRAIIAPSAPAGSRPVLDEKKKWHRRPCRCPPLGGGVFSTGRDAGATDLFFLAKRGNDARF